MTKMNLIVNFNLRPDLKESIIDSIDTDLKCAHNAINKITIEIDSERYGDYKYKFTRENNNRYSHPFNSIEFVSTIISPELLENVSRIKLELDYKN